MLASLKDASFVLFNKVLAKNFNLIFNSINKAIKRFYNQLCLKTGIYNYLERASNVNSNSKLKTMLQTNIFSRFINP